MVGERAADRGGHLQFDPRGAVAADVGDGQRMALAGAGDAWGIGEKSGKTVAVEGGRHGENSQIGAERGGGIERERQREVIVEAAFVNFVEQQSGDAGEFGVGLNPREEHAVGHGDDPGRLADLAVEAGGVAESRAGGFAGVRRHAFGGGAGGEAAGHEQQHLAAAPRLSQQRGGDGGGLARPGRCDQQRARAIAQRGEEFGKDGVDGEGRAHASSLEGPTGRRNRFARHACFPDRFMIWMLLSKNRWRVP